MIPHTPHVEIDALARIAVNADLSAHGGDCQRPIVMAGRSQLVDAGTGRVLHRSSSNGQTVAVRCRNRRAAVCPACSALYRLDAYHLIAAGLRGGKDTPAEVAGRPRMFVTLTAPSFGRVHLGPDTKVHHVPATPGAGVETVAGVGIRQATRPSAPRRSRLATTTRGRCCSTPTRDCCGPG